MTENNSIFIGNGPFMNYITSVIMQFTSEDSEEVIVKARGKLITRAVDVVETVLHDFLKDIIYVNDIKIGSETIKDGEKDIRVSTIEIILHKKK